MTKTSRNNGGPKETNIFKKWFNNTKNISNKKRFQNIWETENVDILKQNKIATLNIFKTVLIDSDLESIQNSGYNQNWK